MTETAFINDLHHRTPLTREAVAATLKEARGNRELCRRAIAFGISRSVHPVRLIQWLGTFHLRDFALCDNDLQPNSTHLPIRS